MCPMATIGYAASMEQFHPNDLLDWCEQAEGAGFLAGFMVSEHFHPWTPQQGQAGFAWSFMGALGLRTSLRFGTAVTCPGFRYHPAVIAHAAATLGAMFSRIEHMRVVPFDLRSFGQLVGSTFGSLATLLPLLHANGDLANILEAIGKLFGHLSGGG